VSDQEGEQLTRLLTDLADDPDAPASTITARTVLEAARAAATGGTDQRDRPGAVPQVAAAGAEPASVGDMHLLAVRAEAARTKAARRRTALFSLAAAAAVAAVAAIVIPLVNSGNSTTTSANSAQDGALAAASAAEQSVPGAPAESAAAGGAADAGTAPSAGTGAAAGAAPEVAPGTDGERPPPGDRAVTSLVPTGAPANPQPTDGVAQSCWPPLPAAAEAALMATLPAGAFQAPAPLTAACGPDPVAGAAVTGTAPGTALEVRVSKADSGRCARGDSEAGVRCVQRAEGVYLATDSGGSSTAYVYGNGEEVTVGAPVNSGLTPSTSGLTADQTVAAAQAVLGGLG
jgi:hypothetical protein